MSAIFNPLSGDIVLIPANNGGASPAPTKYETTFTTADWQTSEVGFYTITVPFITHGIALPNATVYEFDGVSSYSQIFTDVVVLSNSNVKLKVSELPDNRFTGKVVIS